ncbi:MAG TPA: hypothetical protein VMF65_07885, partial [Acidimicrobiales bacterium]|nr:hypothetical protein [Acidimicrobiales bacterium]
PEGTKMYVFPVKNPVALKDKLPAGQSYLVSYAVSWLAPNGTSPAARTAITLTITDPSLKAGDALYLLTAGGLVAAGVATANGKVTVTFKTDPDYVVANVPQLTGVAGQATVKGSTVAVKIGCSSSVKCTGSGTVTIEEGKAKTAHSVVLAEGRFAIAAGHTASVPFAGKAPAGKILSSLAGGKVNGGKVAGVLTLSLLGGKTTTHRLTLP